MSHPAFASALSELSSFLRAHGETHWADGIDQIAAVAEARDGSAARRFLRLHGGMGSLSDLVFHSMNKNATPDEDLDEINKRFLDLDGRALEVAKCLIEASSRSR